MNSYIGLISNNSLHFWKQKVLNPFLSTGGTSTGTPVRVYKIMKKSKNSVRDYLTLRYFPQRVVSEF